MQPASLILRGHASSLTSSGTGQNRAFQTGLTGSAGEPDSPLCSLHISGAWGPAPSLPLLLFGVTQQQSRISGQFREVLTISVRIQLLFPLLTALLFVTLPSSHTSREHPDTRGCQGPTEAVAAPLLLCPLCLPPLSQCLVHHERDTLPETQDSHCHPTQEQRDRGDGASTDEEDSRDGGCAWRRLSSTSPPAGQGRLGGRLARREEAGQAELRDSTALLGRGGRLLSAHSAMLRKDWTAGLTAPHSTGWRYSPLGSRYCLPR